MEFALLSTAIEVITISSSFHLRHEGECCLHLSFQVMNRKRELKRIKNESYKISHPRRRYLHDNELLLAGTIDQPLKYLTVLVEVTGDATRENRLLAVATL